MTKAYAALPLLICVLLAACGGGGGSDSPPVVNIANASPAQPQSPASPASPASPSEAPVTPASPDQPTPAPTTPTSTPSPAPEPTPAPPVNFAASVTSAPQDGAVISGAISIVVTGSTIQNVELLPAESYTPLYARGIITDGNTAGTIQFDTRLLPDGPISVRVAAYDSPPGQSGREMTAMSARTWTIRNGTPVEFTANLVEAPADRAFIQPNTTLNFAVSGSNLGDVELVSANDPSILYGRFTIAADKRSATLSFSPRISPLYGSYYLQVLAWDAPPGQAGRQIVVMPPRTILIHTPLGCASEGTCGMPAP